MDVEKYGFVVARSPATEVKISTSSTKKILDDAGFDSFVSKNNICVKFQSRKVWIELDFYMSGDTQVRIGSAAFTYRYASGEGSKFFRHLLQVLTLEKHLPEEVQLTEKVKFVRSQNSMSYLYDTKINTNAMVRCSYDPNRDMFDFDYWTSEVEKCISFNKVNETASKLTHVCKEAVKMELTELEKEFNQVLQCMKDLKEAAA
jgi:hypothetical protein